MSVFWALHTFRSMQAASDASAARTDARGARLDVRMVADQLDRTLLACEAMWTILRDKMGVTDEELLERINELDLSDGKLDGKVTRAGAVTCENCKRSVSKRFVRCMYCGHELQRDAFA